MAPVGIFDSGVGGLTVARAIIDQLPDEDIIYVGDTANGPYGPLTIPEIRAHALAIGDDLVSRGVKALVIACNTASSAMLRDARERYAPVPVVEVILPAVRHCAKLRRSSRNCCRHCGSRCSGWHHRSFRRHSRCAVAPQRLPAVRGQNPVPCQPRSPARSDQHHRRAVCSLRTEQQRPRRERRHFPAIRLVLLSCARCLRLLCAGVPAMEWHGVVCPRRGHPPSNRWRFPPRCQVSGPAVVALMLTAAAPPPDNSTNSTSSSTGVPGLPAAAAGDTVLRDALIGGFVGAAGLAIIIYGIVLCRRKQHHTAASKMQHVVVIDSVSPS